MSSDASELQCIDTLAASGAPPRQIDEVVLVCERRAGDAAEQACLDELLTPRYARY